jgi:hypothetical protein
MAKYIEECDPDGPIIIYIQKVDNKNHNMCGRILSGTYNRQYLRNIYKKKGYFITSQLDYIRINTFAGNTIYMLPIYLCLNVRG